MINKIIGQCKVEIVREDVVIDTFTDTNDISGEQDWKNEIIKFCATGGGDLTQIRPNCILLEVDSIGSPPPQGLVGTGFQDNTFDSSSYNRDSYKAWIASLITDEKFSDEDWTSSSIPVVDNNLVPVDFDDWWPYPENTNNTEFAYGSVENYIKPAPQRVSFDNAGLENVNVNNNILSITYKASAGGTSDPWTTNSIFGYLKVARLQHLANNGSTIRDFTNLEFAPPNAYIDYLDYEEREFRIADKLNISYTISIELTESFHEEYLQKLGLYLLGGSNSELKPLIIAIQDSNGGELNGKDVDINGEAIGASKSLEDLVLNDHGDTVAPYEFSSQEFFVDNGAVPEKYVIKTAGGTIVSTGDIETQTSWTEMDTLKITYKFT